MIIHQNTLISILSLPSLISNIPTLASMAMRSVIMSRSPALVRFMNSRLPFRLSSDQSGRVLDDEEKARENLYIKKMEKEKMEKLKQKLESKEKTDYKDKSDEKKP